LLMLLDHLLLGQSIITRFLNDPKIFFRFIDIFRAQLRLLHYLR
jgi:hypothetical protein